jgi:antitoxin (DNA-binding transcriptional repressor) of toxin-antitoxin stability system
MSEGGSPARVGVRELRQNLSVYLRRVECGEILDVTEHGRLVARLGPTPAMEKSALERMIAEGRATAASRTIDELPTPARLAAGVSCASEALRRMRRDERW